MRQKKYWFTISGILAVLALPLMLPTGAVAASKYKVLHRFTGGSEGSQPLAGLTFDTAGNLYGTTAFGGNYGYGTVYQLTPNSDGTWTEHVLDSFTGGADGDTPAAGLIFDIAGNLYGTTAGGGSTGDSGTIFRLAPNSDGSWTERAYSTALRGAVTGPIPLLA
jgi:uncharacterized repeat protein (TIGR03803 family)